MNNNKNLELLIKTKIWEKQYPDFIDYLDDKFVKKEIKINSSGILCRNNKEIIFNKGKSYPKPYNKLLKIKKNKENGKFIVKCDKYTQDLMQLPDQKAAYIVYSGLSFEEWKTGLYRLYQGDIFKIGRVFFKILDIHINGEKSLSYSDNDDIINNFSSNSLISNLLINGQQIIKGSFSPNNSLKHKKFFSKNDTLNRSNSILTPKISNHKRNESFEVLLNKSTQKLNKVSSFKLMTVKQKNHYHNQNTKNDNFLKKKEKLRLKKPKNKKNQACRICYGEESDNDNPLISPCLCKGSMKYIHYLCLKNWFNSKIENDISLDTEEREKGTITYNTRDISCELCKEKLPDYIRYNNKLYNITFYRPDYEEFIVLESVRADEERIKYIHLVSFDNKNDIVIGRSNKCQLSIPEISISRVHSVIHKRFGELFLEDNNSRYGTLVLLQNNNMIMDNKFPLKLQINNTYIKLRIHIPFYLKCCGYQNTLESNKFDYAIQNKKNIDILSCFVIKENNLNTDNDYEEENQSEEKKSSNNNDNKTNKSNNSKINNKNTNNNKNITNSTKKLIIYSKNSSNSNKKNIINENLSNLLLDEDNANINKIEDKIRSISNEKDNSFNKNGVNNYFLNPLLNRFKKIFIKKEEKEENRLPRLGDINISSYKDNFSLIFDKTRTNSSKKQLNLLNLNRSDCSIEPSNYPSTNSPRIFLYRKQKNNVK